jgi:hypothetical protein
MARFHAGRIDYWSFEASRTLLAAENTSDVAKSKMVLMDKSSNTTPAAELTPKRAVVGFPNTSWKDRLGNSVRSRSMV